MIVEAQELLEEIFSGMSRKGPDGWVGLQVTAIGVGAGTDFRTKAAFSDGTSRSFRLESATASACVKLRKKMYQPGKGTWYIGRFAISETGECGADYDYDSIPLDPDFEETLDDIREELIDDQERYPRDQEALPEWHPSRLPGGG